MVELQLKARRGGFFFDVACTFAAAWSVVFGPSGAGKSTLLRLIAGLETPDEGRIAIHGEYVTDTLTKLQLPPGQRLTGMAAQQPALFPHLSVNANVAYGLAGRVDLGRQSARARVADMLEVVEASHLADRSPRALSGGEAQRVSLARALAPMPRLLLLDEPLSALDAESRDRILTRLQAWLTGRQIQTILVTHDAADALATGAEVALLSEGKLAALGPADEVLATERERLIRRLHAGSGPSVAH